MKYTQAPWKLSHSQYANAPYVVFTGASPDWSKRYPLSAEGCNWIAEVHQDESPEHADHRGNAHLIAAAPDLYEACLAAFKELNTYWHGDYENRPVARLLQQAVLKAEGNDRPEHLITSATGFWVKP